MFFFNNNFKLFKERVGIMILDSFWGFRLGVCLLVFLRRSGVGVGRGWGMMLVFVFRLWLGER